MIPSITKVDVPDNVVLHKLPKRAASHWHGGVSPVFYELIAVDRLLLEHRIKLKRWKVATTSTAVLALLLAVGTIFVHDLAGFTTLIAVCVVGCSIGLVRTRRLIAHFDEIRTRLIKESNSQITEISDDAA
jgi:hypothetical protein